jgi:multisubunit Na+/H+ antiporter MnhG subunit
LSVFLPIKEGIQFMLSAIAMIGAIVLFRYFFFYIELLAGCNLSNSLKSSIVATKGNFFSITFLIITLILINFLVMLSVNLFGIIVSIFILFTLPVSILILADVYSQLTHDSSGDASQDKALRIEDNVIENTEKELV